MSNSELKWKSIKFNAATASGIDWNQLEKNLGIACNDCGRKPVVSMVYIETLIPIKGLGAVRGYDLSHGLCANCAKMK